MNARRSYQRIWKQDRRYFGAKGQPAPLMQFAPKGQGFTTTGTSVEPGQLIPPGAPRIINIGPGARRQLKRGNPAARNAIEHEFARYFGPDAPLMSSDGNAGAGGANAVANRLAHYRNTGKGNPKKYNRTHLPYFGQNPQTIKWPTS